MGEHAEDILDGIFCEGCGIFMGDAVGHPRRCAGCRGTHTPSTNPKKVRKAERRDQRINSLQELCRTFEIDVQEFNTASYRLSRLMPKGRVTIDYYPTKNKVFYHANREWSQISNLETFLFENFVPEEDRAKYGK